MAPLGRVLAILLCLHFHAADARTISDSSFADYVAKYGRPYVPGSLEYRQRQALFEHRLMEVSHHNSRPDRLWNAAVNHLSDRTNAELERLFGWHRLPVGGGRSGGKSPHLLLVQNQSEELALVEEEEELGLPEEVSWGNLSAVLADTDQQACGSCWAVASSTVLDANAEIKGHSRTFSTQELVSCVPNPHKCGGTGGCKGATVELAMHWAMEYGLVSASERPYLATEDRCSKSSAFLASPGIKEDFDEVAAVGRHLAASSSSPGLAMGLTAWERLPENSYAPLLRAVAQHGTVAVSVGATMWHNYDSGIFDSCKKDTIVNHAVTLIGYGKEAGTKYWTIKNSWGLNWGEKGNIRLLRRDDDAQNQCGTDRKPADGTGCEGGPPEVTVCGMCGVLYDSVIPLFASSASVASGI